MTEPAQPLKDRGYFANVDVPTARRVCQEADADAAAVYLTLVMGTDGTGLKSSWGREAIRKRLSMSWRRVDRCVTRLEELGVIEWPEKGQRIVNVQLRLIENRRMGEGYHAGLERARKGIGPQTDRERKVAANMVRDGWLDAEGKLIKQRPMDRAYLPLSLVGDVKGMPIQGRTCILERLRKARDPMAFLMLVQMYQGQDLPETGGTDRRWSWIEFAGEEVIFRTANRAIIRASDPKQYALSNDELEDHLGTTGKRDWDAYWTRLSILKDAGAVEFVLALVEDDEHDSMPIYPVGVQRHGRLVESEPEHSVGTLAIGAALALMGDPEKLEGWLAAAGDHWLVPVDRLYRKATIRGIPRLVARPRTNATRQWQAERVERCRQWAEHFVGLIAEHAPELLEDGSPLRRAVDFKETSRRLQGDINEHIESPKHTAAFAAEHDDDGFQEMSSWGA